MMPPYPSSPPGVRSAAEFSGSRRVLLSPDNSQLRSRSTPEADKKAPTENKMEELDKVHGGMPRCIRSTPNGHQSWSALRAVGRFIWHLWCLLTLNFLVVHLLSSGIDDAEAAMTALRDLFTVIGVIDSLLLSAGVGPFLQLQADMELSLNEHYWATQFSAFFLLCMLCTCLASLVLISVYLVYLHGVHVSQRLKETARLPIFGLFLMTFIWSVMSATIWVLCRIYLYLPRYYFWGFIGLTVGLFVIDVPFLIYAFLIRMPGTHKGRGTPRSTIIF